MPNSIDRNKKKVAPVVAAILVILYMVPIVVMVVFAMLGLIEMGETLIPILLMILYVVIGAAVILGVLAAKRQRLREIDGGEEEDASQY